MARWIANYISLLSDETLWIEGRGIIKKVLLNFTALFWLLVIRYRLFLTASNNVLIWKGAAPIASFMVGCDIDFAAILRYEIHDRSFREVINMPFPCLI